VTVTTTGATQTATNPAASSGQTAPALPFEIASRVATRFSFTTGTVTIQAAANTPINPIQIPAVGFLAGIMLQVTQVTTAGTGLTADAPFTGLATVELRTAAGNDLIVPVTGYQLYLINKYGAQYSAAPWSDVKASFNYSSTNTAQSYFLFVPAQIDADNGLGTLPALASNRSYQLALTAGSATATATASTGGSITVNGTAYYWTEPTAATPGGVPQTTQPDGLGTMLQWQLEQPPVTPGDKYIKHQNVGNVLHTVIYTLRNSSGVRIDAAGWPSVCEFYFDNNPLFYLTQAEWQEFMARRWYGFDASTKDVVKGLDTGVYVLPFFAMGSGRASNGENTRAQLLPTLDSSLVQLRGTSWGASASTLEIITGSVIPTDAASLYAK
jgi:hypothetical protein